MIRGLIVNPHSGRGNRRGLALAQRLEGAPGVSTAILERFGDLPAILRSFATKGVDTLVISAGDGTIHAIHTELVERPPFAKVPRLVVLPDGTTNMTAANFGLWVRSPARQAALIADPGALERTATVKTRPTVKVANAADGQVRYGLFLATGAIWRGVRFCLDTVHATGLKGDWATGVTLAAGLARALLSRARAGEDRLDQPYQMRIVADGETMVDSLQVVFFATTLDRLILRSRPFWGGSSGPLRATAVGHPPPSLVWTPRVMYGGEGRKLPNQCRSFSARTIEVSVKCPFVMDGEIFEAPDDAPLRIESGPEFTYLCSP